MLAIVPQGRIDPAILRSFRNLASTGLVKARSSPGHKDGWGIVVWENSIPKYLGRRPVNAFTDDAFDEACRSVEEFEFESPLIAHLRKASVGAKTVENTHPFVSGKWAFAHNGTIRRLKLRSTTDSEWFFRELMAVLSENGGKVKNAIANQVDLVRKSYRYSSLAFLLSDGESVYAYRDYTGNDGEYYAMYYTHTPNGLVIAQERFFDSNWRELENGNLLISDRQGNIDIENLRAIETAATMRSS
jgi:predicted glutamine amidotransferase